jgi:hypothetical protein
MSSTRKRRILGLSSAEEGVHPLNGTRAVANPVPIDMTEYRRSFIASLFEVKLAVFIKMLKLKVPNAG